MAIAIQSGGNVRLNIPPVQVPVDGFSCMTSYPAGLKRLPAQI